MEHFETLLFTACLTLFTAWLTYLTHVLRSATWEMESSGSQADEIISQLEMCQKAIAIMFEKMPTIDRIQELVPEFHINQQESNGKHLFDFISNMLGINEQSLQTPTPARGPEGRFHGPPQIEENTPTPNEAPIQSPPDD